jgi:hypothetical protein
LQEKLMTLLRALLAGCGSPTSPALTGGLLRLAKELSWHSTDSPCVTLSLAVMARLREAANLGHFSDAGSPLTGQAADVAHHMLRTFGEASIAVAACCSNATGPLLYILCDGATGPAAPG